MRQRNPSLKWEEIAVLARTHAELAPIRALLEEEAIPVCWTEERDKLPPVFRIREIARFLNLLRQKRHELATADDLLGWLDQQCLPEPPNPWIDLLRDILASWRIESLNAEMPVEAARESLCDALLEFRRDPARGHGVFLGTVHGAKGMEFEHVFVPGGGWSTPKMADRLEEERRVYYVAMTRAKETLCLFERGDAINPHTPLLRGDYILERNPEGLSMPDRAVFARRYAILGMKDVDLGFAGRKSREDTIHKHLAELQVGSALRMEQQGDGIWLLDSRDHRVAKLSKAAFSGWQKKIPHVQSLKVIAMVQWRREDSGEEFNQLYRCDRWEIPLAEVTFFNE